MYYGLVYFPKIQKDRINKLRSKYDPTFELIDPHLTIIYPVPASVGKNRIINHITEVLKDWNSFELNFKPLVKSWDHWLFLSINKGKMEIKKLTMELYSGMLSEFYREDIDFIPHIALGLFIKNKSKYDFQDPEKLIFDEESYQKAYLEAKQMNFDFECMIDNLDLVELTDDFSEIKTIKKFWLVHYK